MTDKPISRKANIVVQDLETEVLIYDLTTNKAFCLNQTAGLVYQLCDGRRTVAEISDLMSKELKTLVSEDFVWLALDGLKKDGLLENTDELANHFGGLTRREIVKRVGLASMVMLPLISSVVAPSAVMALSCQGSGTFPPGASYIIGQTSPTGSCITDAENFCNTFMGVFSVSDCCSGMGTSFNCSNNTTGFTTGCRCV
jgi:hypothetical protein